MGLFICQGCDAEYPSWDGKCPKCGGSETIRLQTNTDKMVGRLVKGKWTILKKLGQGGMGAVYLAEQAGIGQRVALKFLKSEFSNDKELSLRFKNEAKAYGQVAHPNAVTLHDFGQDEDGNLFIAMEYCEGVDLKRVIAENKQGLPVGEGVEIVQQVAEVLATAHSKNIIHRDLKPENIMIRRGLRGVHAKVLDFGIAKLITEGTQLTMAGAIAGTPRYMSPEQVEGKPIDHRADIYSLGVVLFEVLTGRQAFDGMSIADILRKQVMDPMPHLKDFVQGAEYDTIDAVIQKACAKKPADRWPDLVTFSAALSQSTPTQQFSRPPLGNVTPSPAVTGGATEPAWSQQDANAATMLRPGSPLVTPTGTVIGGPLQVSPLPSVVTSPGLVSKPSRVPLNIGAVAVLAAIGVVAAVTLKAPPDPVAPQPPVVARTEPVVPQPLPPTPTLPTAAEEASRMLREQEARSQLGRAKTELELAHLVEADTYLKAVEEKTQSHDEAVALLARIRLIREKLAEGNRLKASGKCPQALPVYEEILRLNPRVPDAVSGAAYCREGTINTRME